MRITKQYSLSPEILVACPVHWQICKKALAISKVSQTYQSAPSSSSARHPHVARCRRRPAAIAYRHHRRRQELLRHSRPDLPRRDPLPAPKPAPSPSPPPKTALPRASSSRCCFSSCSGYCFSLSSGSCFSSSSRWLSSAVSHASPMPVLLLLLLCTAVFFLLSNALTRSPLNLLNQEHPAMTRHSQQTNCSQIFIHA